MLKSCERKNEELDMAKKLQATKYKYSKHELRVLAVMSKRPRSTLQLANAFYGDKANKKFGVKTRPRFAIVSVRCTIEALRRKLVANNEHIRIEKSNRAGPHPVDFWIADNAVHSSA